MRSPSAWSACSPPHVPDPEQALHAELDQLLEDDRRAGAAHARSLHRHRLALPRAREAEEAALAVHLRRALEVRLGDVLRPQGVAGEEAGVRVVSGLGAQVDRHRAEPYGFLGCWMRRTGSRARS